MAVWVVESVDSNPRSWSGAKGGTNLSYRVKIKTKDGSKQPPRDSAEYAGVELVQKEATPAPAAGGELTGDVVIRPWKTKEGEAREDLKFEKERSFGGGNGGGGRGWQPRIDDDPVVYAGKQAAIAAQTSLERATELVLSCGVDGAVAEEVSARVIAVAEEYEAHIHDQAVAAGQRVRDAKKE